MNDYAPEPDDAARKVVGKKLFAVIERQLIDDVRRLRLGLEMQMAQHPWAKQELNELVAKQIDEAELALLEFRGTRVTPSFDEATLIEKEKIRFLTQFLALQKANPSLPIDDAYRKMSIAIDHYYPETLQQLANERRQAESEDASNPS